MARTRPPWERMIARFLSLPVDIASPILRTGGLIPVIVPSSINGYNRIIGLTKGAWHRWLVFDAHLVDLFHDHVYHIVTLTEMMMEGQGHSVTDIKHFQEPP